MSVDPLSFLDQPTQEGQSSSDPLDFLSEKSTNPLRKTGRHLAQAAKGALNLNPIIAGYNLLTTSVNEGAHRSRERVSEQAKKDLQAIEEKRERGEDLTRLEKIHYDRTKQLSQRKNEKAAGIDTESLINRGVKASTGIDLEPEDLGETITNIGSSLVNPKNLVKNAKKIPQLFTKSGREALRVQAGWKSLDKAVKGNFPKEELLQFAKDKGLNPKETTLLLQSEGKTNLLGKIAKKTKGFEGAVEGLQKKLGANYESLKAKGSLMRLGQQGVTNLANDLKRFNADLGKTLIQGPDTTAARKAIKEGIKKIESGGATIEDLINTHKNLGQSINWNNVDPKGVLLNKSRGLFMNAIERANPRIAKELKYTDEAWKKYKKFSDILDKKQALFKVKGIDVPTSSLAFGTAALLLKANPLTAAKYLAAKEAVQRFSTALLTNPRLQGLGRKLTDATLSGSPEKQRKIMTAIQKILKTEDPELYEEMDF
jgi:hypothetical protein